MNFPAAIEQLRATPHSLSMNELAAVFDVHLSTVRRWIKRDGFPKSNCVERRRSFRPDLVLAWAIEQHEAMRNMLTIEQVCERVQIYPETWATWVKQGGAPTWSRRELGSGRYLWDAKDIDKFLADQYGGFPRHGNKPARELKQIPRGQRGPKPHEKITAASH
jgi:predicted DNA-binding transcriptional regulator AlpA